MHEEGFRPTVDSDGDVRFTREGRTYFIQVVANDPGFFRVVLPNFMKIDGDSQRSKALAAADAANSKSKVAKVFTVRDNVWASVEIYTKAPEDFKGVFRRTLSGLDNGAFNFAMKVRE